LRPPSRRTGTGSPGRSVGAHQGIPGEKLFYQLADGRTDVV
jgi:hypothetical protein